MGELDRALLFRVPEGARGKRLTIGLVAALGGSRTRTTLSFRVS